MQVANLGGQLCEGFGRTISSVQNVAAQLAQGQSRTEAAVLTTGLQGQLQQKDNTIAQLDRERLLREMGAKDARIAQLEAQNFNTNLANNAAQQNRNDMQSMLNTILAHLPTTSSGGTASR